MSDLIKIMIFGLVSFIIGHTAHEKLRNEQVASIAIDSVNNIYRLQLIKEKELENLPDSLKLITDGFRNAFFITKSDSNDVLQWVRNVGGSPFELPNKIYTGPKDALYLIGTVGNQFAFNNTGSIGVDQTSASSAFIVKFNSKGKEEWATFIDGLDVYRYFQFDIINGQPTIQGFFNGFFMKQTIWPNSDIYWR